MARRNRRIKRRRSGPGRGNEGTVPRGLSVPLVTVCRTTAPASILKIGTDVGTARFFSLNALPGFTDFTSLFQYYKISWVEAQYNLITPNISGTVPFPRLYTALELQSFSTPTSVDVVTAYTSCEQYQFGTSKTTFTRRFSPRCLLTAAGINNAVLSDGWLSTANAGITYWGLAEFLSPYNTVSNPNTVVEYNVRYCIQLKGAK